MRELLNDEVYKRHLEARGRLQTVLIGYSESNEGERHRRLAHSPPTARSGHLTEALREAGKEHVLFYSRGGSIPRGGGRIDYPAARGAWRNRSAARCVSPSRARMSRKSYGLRPNAMRTLGACVQYACTGDPRGQARGTAA